MNTHNLVIDFGKHKGTLYTRLPVSYLRWMVQCGHSQEDVARAELDRRGTVLPIIEISGHAIDRASIRLLKHWKRTAKSNDEGLHAWLCRICVEAVKENEPDENGNVYYDGIKLVFSTGEWPVLKTCMAMKNKQWLLSKNDDR